MINQELIVTAQARDDYGLDLGNGSGAEEKLMKSRHRLKVAQIRFDD